MAKEVGQKRQAAPDRVQAQLGRYKMRSDATHNNRAPATRFEPVALTCSHLSPTELHITLDTYRDLCTMDT